MTLDGLRRLLSDPDGPLAGLPGDTPVLRVWNCSGYIDVDFVVAEGWVYHGEWVTFPSPFGSPGTPIIKVVPAEKEDAKC